MIFQRTKLPDRQKSIHRIVILLLVFVSGLLAGCAKYPVVGSFSDYNEVFIGTVGSNMLTGTAYIEVEGKVTKTRCSGSAHVTYVPPLSLSCAGQRGRADLICDGGRVVRGNYTVTSCATGFGSGRDQYGNQFTFTFGMSEAEAEEHIRKELALAARRPDLPAYKPKETRREKGFSSGTGFFVTGDGYMITSYHVVEDAKEITIILPDGSNVRARFVQGDPANDVALVKVDAVTNPLTVRDSSNLTKGEEVFTLGYPLISIQGQDQKATFGRVNSLTGVQGDIRFIQIEVPIQPGNSGGPLIDMNGQVVGIVTATLDQLIALRASGSLPQNVNYAVKSDYIIPLLRSYLKSKWEQSALGEKANVPELVKRTEPSVALVIAK